MKENKTYLTEQLITYIGNKRTLLNFIDTGVYTVKRELDKEKLVIFDGFAGSGVVSRYFKQHSSLLISNDFEHYSYVINKTYLTNKKDLDFDYIEKIVNELNRLKFRTDLGVGLIEELYAPKDDKDIKLGERAFYTNQNAKIIDNIRRTIDLIVDKSEYKDLFLTLLMTKASVHVNTGGVFKGFYKDKETNIGKFGGTGENALVRILGEIELPMPILSDFDCDSEVYNKDTNKLVTELKDIDLAYFDPPYDQHPYGSNYFMLNLIYDYKKPEKISSVSGIPEDWQRSDYNKVKPAEQALDDLIKNTTAKYILLSYNDEGHITDDILRDTMSKYGTFNSIIQKPYDTYKASRNLKERSNKVSETLYILKKKR